MEFKQLEAYVSVVKNRSFSKAADELFLTQPSISASISSLESELGVVLLDRGSKETRQTKEGRMFYGYAINILNSRDRALYQMKNSEKDLNGVLEIRASSIPGNFIVPNLIADFSRLYPNVKFNVQQMDTKGVWTDILDGFGEVGFTGAFEKNKLKYVTILKDELIIIAPNNIKFRAIQEEKRLLKMEDLSGERFVAREDGSATWNIFKNMIEKESLPGNEMKIVATGNSLEQVISLVKAGLGVSAVSKLAMDSLPKGILSFEMEEKIPEREIYMVYNKDVTLSPIAKKFTEYVENELF